MTSAQTAGNVLDRHYLELRCEILNLAAALDRIERSEGFDAVAGDPRLARLAEGLQILSTSGTDRAERVQRLFSDDYQPGWNT
jgi:hypothetical protein